MWNSPKDVEQRKDQQYVFSAFWKMDATLDVEQALDVEQPKVSHQEGWWPSPLEEQDVPLLHFEKEDGYPLHI